MNKMSRKNFFLFPVQVLSFLCLFSLMAWPIQAHESGGTGNRLVQEPDIQLDQENILHVHFQGREPLSHIISQQDQTRMQVILPEVSVPAGLVGMYRLDDYHTRLKSLLVQDTARGAELTWLWSGKQEFEILDLKDSAVFRFYPGGADGSGSTNPSGPTELLSRDQNMHRLEQDFIIPGMQEHFTGEPVSIDLQNAEVEHVLRLILSITDYNLILDEQVRGRISLRMKNVPWDQALDQILAQKDLAMVRRDNIIRVTTAEKMESLRERLRQAREARVMEHESLMKLEPLQQEFIPIKYARASELEPRIQDFLSQRGRIIHDERTNTLIIQDTSSRLAEIRALISNLDRPESQVLIEARVVYATEEFRRELGIDWHFAYQSPGLSQEIIRPETFNFPGDMGNLLGVGYLGRESRSFSVLEARLRLGEAQGKSSIISAPRIMTLNNQRAEIEQGTRIAREVPDERGTRTEYLDAVLKLVVQPQITPDNNLILNLEVRDDTPDGDDISTKLARTTLLVEDGETAIIGGIKQLAEGRGQTRIPGLHRIPVLGWFFKHEFVDERMDELLIFIRPQIR